VDVAGLAGVAWVRYRVDTAAARGAAVQELGVEWAPHRAERVGSWAAVEVVVTTAATEVVAVLAEWVAA